MSNQLRVVLRKMQDDYVAKLPQMLDIMAGLAMDLRTSDDYVNGFENLYRAVHSLKGTAGTYGVSIISSICHPFEDYLTTIHEEAALYGDRHVATCLSFIDLLRRTSTLLASGRESFPDIEAELATISAQCRLLP